MTKTIPGRRGGTLHPQQSGQPAPPNAGRKPNPFKHHIQELAESDNEIVLKGRILDADGNPTGQLVKVAVSLPGALGIVAKAYKMAAKGDANARRWLTETGWGKNFTVGDDETPLITGFSFIVEDRRAISENSNDPE